MNINNKNDNVLGEVFDNSLKSYGITVSQVSVIIMLFLSTFGFSNLFNVGVWTLSTIFSFLVVHIIRRYISSNVLSVIVWSLFLMFLVIFATMYICYIYKIIDISVFINNHRNFSSVYFSMLISIPLAFILISYQKQEIMFGMEYPKKIVSAIDKLYSISFYKKNTIYELTVQEVNNDTIKINTVLKYEIINRTLETQKWIMQYKYKEGTGNILSAKFNDENLFIYSRDYMVGRGIEIPININSKDSGKIYYEAEEFFKFNQSELYTTYFPSDVLTIIVNNPLEKEVLLDIEGLCSTPYSIIKKDSATIVKIEEGVLQYQGVRINFLKREKYEYK